MADIVSDTIDALAKEREASLSALLQNLGNESASSSTPGFAAAAASVPDSASADAWTKLALQDFAQSASAASAATSIPAPSLDTTPGMSALSSPLVDPQAAGLTASTNAKIALAQTLYPGIPVFGF